MGKNDWSCLILMLCLTASVGCGQMIEDSTVLNISEPLPSTKAATAVAQADTATRVPQANPTNSSYFPALPTAEPTISATEIPDFNWQTIGDLSTGMKIDVPTDWVDLSGQIDVSTATSRLGLAVLLMADSERTGSSLLAGKDLSEGAFAAGIISNLEPHSASSLRALTQLVMGLGQETAVINPPEDVLLSLPPASLTSPAPSIEFMGATVDITGDLTGLLDNGRNLHTRFLLFPFEEGDGAPIGESQAVFIFSAPTDEWARYAPLFAEMAKTIAIYPVGAGISIHDGRASVLGNLTESVPASSWLDKRVNNVWSFESDGPGYGTLTLTPSGKGVDLSMKIIDPAGQTIATVDSGYADNTEIIVDLYLRESGTYLVEVGERFGNGGRYTLELELSDTPLFTGEGRIELRQGIQIELTENARHTWIFDGTAGHQVSIVLDPGEELFDAILELYGPAGERLVALDEGFSGDAEVIAGFELSVTGEYAISVQSFAGKGGTYTLSLDEGGESVRNFFDAGDLISGEPKVIELRDHEAQAWFFEGRVGDVISINVDPVDDTLDLDIWLLDPKLQRLAIADAFADGQPESIDLELSEDGQYVVLVRDFYGEPGKYQILLNSTHVDPPDDAGQLAYGDTVTGTLSVGQSVIWYFSGEVDDVIDVILQPIDGDNDVILLLQDPQTNTLWEIDDALAGSPEQLKRFKVPIEGRWRVVVKEFFGESGSYTLTVTRAPR